MQVLESVAWLSHNRALSRRHLVGFTGLPPTAAGARTVCGRAILTDRLRDPASASGDCVRCAHLLARDGRDFYKRQQRRWTAVARRGGLGTPGEDR